VNPSGRSSDYEGAFHRPSNQKANIIGRARTRKPLELLVEGAETRLTRSTLFS
jgi:hypothetical protein